MRRRDFLTLPLAAAPAFAQDKPKRDWVTATASRDTTSQIGVVLSSFTGAEEMDGNKIRPLREPCAPSAALTSSQLDDMLRLALELGGGKLHSLSKVLAADDWVVIKVTIPAYPGASRTPAYVPGAATDPRLVRTLIQYAAEHQLGRRFSIADGPAFWRGDAESGRLTGGWTAPFADYEGLSYQTVVTQLSHQFPGLEFDLIDLNFDGTLLMPVEGRVFAKRNPDGVYHVPKTLRQCDKVISVAPLQTHTTASIALSILNYEGFAPGSRYGFPKQGLAELGDAAEVALDLFSFHPADYSILGGASGIEGDGAVGTGARTRRHNVVIAGPGALAVDAVGAAVMGFDPFKIPHFDLAVRHGYGVADTDTIWTRGNEIAEARSPFRPAGS